MNRNFIIYIFGVISLFATFSCQEEGATWNAYWQNGEGFIQQREFEKAEKELEMAVAEAEKFGEQDSRLPQTLTRLGAVYDAQSKWTKAEPLLERALTIHEKILGPDHPDLVKALRNLGAVYHVQHKFDQGRPLFQRALRIHEGQLGPGHPDVRIDLKNLVGLHVSQALFQKAGPFLTRTLSATHTLEGKTESENFEDHDDFSKLYTAQSQYEKARPYLDQAIDRDEKSWGFQDTGIIGSVHNVAHVLSTPGKMKQAELLLLGELETAVQSDEPTDLRLEQTLSTLATYYRMQNRHAEAITLLERKLQAIKRRNGHKDEEGVEVLSDLAVLHQLDHQDKEAEQLYKDALAIGTTTLGEEHSTVRRVRKILAGALQKRDRN